MPNGLVASNVCTCSAHHCIFIFKNMVNTLKSMYRIGFVSKRCVCVFVIWMKQQKK